MMKKLLIVVLAASTVGCATLTEDAMTPIAFSFSDGANGKCNLSNKRGAWSCPVPSTVSVRKSDDALKYDCETEDGRKAFGSIRSEMGAKIIASAVFLDLGITDAITDKHRQYTESFVIPIATPSATAVADSSGHDNDPGVFVEKLKALDVLKENKQISDEEYGKARLELFKRYMPEALPAETRQAPPPG